MSDRERRSATIERLSDKEYRDAFVAEEISVGLAFQIRAIRKKLGLTQEELAKKMGKAQETVSQWESPNYGKYSISTLKELASAFDVALTVRFLPFSHIVDYNVNLSPEDLAVASFE